MSACFFNNCREQLQNSSIASLITKWWYTYSDYSARWLRLHYVCRAHWLLTVAETSYISNICSWFFFPSTFCIWLHLQYKIQTIIPYSLLFPEALRPSSLVHQIYGHGSLFSLIPRRWEIWLGGANSEMGLHACWCVCVCAYLCRKLQLLFHGHPVEVYPLFLLSAASTFFSLKRSSSGFFCFFDSHK